MTRVVGIDPSLTSTGIADRLWAKVAIGSPSECWPWTARARQHGGYGVLGIAGSPVRAHRLVFALVNGPIADDLVVRHACDNPPCCNPGHLLLGTQQDNVDDCVRRGRASGGRTSRPGERNPNAKLTRNEVEAIRALRASGATNRSVAAAFNISPAQASRICNGKRWAS